MAQIKMILPQFSCTCCIMIIVAVIGDASPICQVTGFRGSSVTCTSEDIDNYILPRGLLSDFHWVETMTLRDCRISDMELGAFENQQSLKYLDISKNKISDLKLEVLETAPQLASLNLSHNLLTGFPPNVKNRTLLAVDLTGNKIKLERGIFDSFTELFFLSLCDNSIVGKDLNENIFEKNNSILYLHLDGNDMSDTSNGFLHAFEKLKVLSLERCFLSEVPLFATKSTLKILILSGNQISTLNESAVFQNFYNLERLELDNNLLHHIHMDIFKPLKKILSINLGGNNLKYLPNRLFQDMYSLKDIDLSRNKILTVPNNIFRYTSLTKLNLSHNRITYLSEHFFTELRKLQMFNFEQNPWQCACLQALLKQVKRLKIRYKSTFYDGKHPVCVSTTDFTCKRDDIVSSIYIEMYDNLKLENHLKRL